MTTPLVIDVGKAMSRAYDADLKWQWESTDEILGYQMDGENNTRSTLTHMEENRFGNTEFAITTTDPTPFHFIYPAAAEVEAGKLRAVQDGTWRPLAVATTEPTMASDIDGVELTPLTGALEIRMWEAGAQEAAPENRIPHNISKIKMHKMHNDMGFVAEWVFNPETNSYEPDSNATGQTFILDGLNSSTVTINLPALEWTAWSLISFYFYDTEGGVMCLSNGPGVKITVEVGKRTIWNLEWEPTPQLPPGEQFSKQVGDILTQYPDITEIKFGNSENLENWNVWYEIEQDSESLPKIYAIPNEQTLLITTEAKETIQANPNSYRLFYSEDGAFNNIQTINIDQLSMSNVFNYSSMFQNCESLTTVIASDDVSSDGVFMSIGQLSMTGEEITAFSMFYGCKSLKTVTLFTVGEITNLNNMFYGCYGLTSVSFPLFTAEHVQAMSYMFRDCNQLTSLDLSQWDAKSLQQAKGMFWGCSNLVDINYGPDGIFSPNAVEIDSMFRGCRSLVKGTIPVFSTMMDLDELFYGCTSMESVDLTNMGNVSGNSVAYMFYKCENLKSVDMTAMNYRTDITNQYRIPKVTDTLIPKNISYMFADCYNLEWVNLTNFTFSGFNNSDFSFNTVDAFREMGKKNPNKPTKIYVNSTAKATIDGYQDFYQFDERTNFDEETHIWVVVDNQVNLPESPSEIFDGELFDMGGLTREDITEVRFVSNDIHTTSEIELENNVENDAPIYVIQDGTKLSFHTPATQFYSPSSIAGMFKDMTALEIVDFGQTETMKFSSRSLNELFYGCTSLRSVDISFRDNTYGYAWSINSMFENCESLTEVKLPDIEIDEASRVFYGCTSLVTLDMSSMKYAMHIESTESMFEECTALTEIKFTDIKNYSSLSYHEWDADRMFRNCYSLESLDLTSMHGTYRDIEYGCSFNAMFENTARDAKNKPITITLNAKFFNYLPGAWATNDHKLNPEYGVFVKGK